MKRATYRQVAIPPLEVISIHALVKRATGSWYFVKRKLRFQSTPSWRGRLFHLFLIKFKITFQSTPSWRGRLADFSFNQILDSISIHALVKRATFFQNITVLRVILFQSTPSWRGRRCNCRCKSRAVRFQSTPSWRGRLRTPLNYIPTGKFQSTPSWRGRRLSDDTSQDQCNNFNPRPREEGDVCKHNFYLKHLLFQSTPSWRGRPNIF